MGKFNFLSRLKNRSRIAPSTQSITATTSAGAYSQYTTSVYYQDTVCIPSVNYWDTVSKLPQYNSDIISQ